METVLIAEEKLRKKAESASMSSSTNTAPSSEHSAQRSAVDPSDQICIIIEDFVREVKMVMQSAISKVASYKASSWSKDWKTTCSYVAKEMLNILETKAQPSHHEDTPDLREEHDKDRRHTEDLTRKVIMVVLDVLDSSSAGRADSKTGDLLITAAEKLIEMTSSSQSERLSRHKKKHKAQLSHEDLQAKATRAVGQVLLSSAGVWERNSSSPEMPSSLASQTDLDSMLEAMTKAGFPTDLIEHNLVVKSRDIVSTIESNMDMLSSASHSSKKMETEDSGVFSIMNYMIQRIKERLKIFFRVTKQLEKERGSAEPSSNVSQDSETLMAKSVHRAKSQAPSVNNDFQTDDPTVSCTDEEVGTESLFRTCCQSQTVLSTQSVPTSDVQLSRVHSVSQLDDLTVTCTNSIISEIVHLYHSDVLSECPTSVTDKDSVEIRDIFQGLGELVRTSRSTSKTSSSDKDLGECEDISLPKLDVSKVDPALDQTSSHCSLKNLLSAQFQSQATQTVCDVLLKTGEKLSISGSTQSFKSSSSPTVFLPPAAASSFYTEAQSTASDIVTSFLKKLWKCCFSAPSDNAGTSTKPAPKQKKQVPSASQSIYRGVHKTVFGFLLGLQKSDKSEKSDQSVILVQEQPKTQAELESGSVLSFRSPPQTISPRFQLNLDSCTDEVISKVVELYKSELLLCSSSKASLHISTSLPEQPSVSLKTIKPKSFLTDAAQLVSDVLIRRFSSQTSSVESGQHFLDSSRKTSSSPVFSPSSADVQDAALIIAETLVDALDRYVESKHSAMTTVNSSSDMLSCLDVVSQISITSIPKDSDTSKMKTYSNPFFIFRKVKDLLSDLLMDEQRSDPSLISAEPERSTDHEVGAFFEEPDSAAEIVAVTQPQSLQRPASEMNQPDPLISDETLKSHADRLTNLMTDILINTADPSHVWKHSSDSVLETAWVRSSLLRDPIQVLSSLVYVFVDDSVKSLLLHLLRLNPAFSRVADQSASFTFSDRHLKRSSAGFEGQNSEKSTGFTEAQNHFTEALTDSQSKMENPLSLLVKSEHSERNHDVSVLDVKSVCVSPTTSSTAGTAMGRETLENLSISSQQYEIYSSSCSPVSESSPYYPNPLDMKKRRVFRFIVGKLAPLFSIRLKKSGKVCPAGLVSDSHQSPSTSGNLQKSSQRESKVLMTPFKKTSNRLSRIFSAIRRALPNPFQCLTPPS
ncbi:uncharacterized protein LOC118800168 [Colossoma macropomum]|uniref:uncharacterized protein LOC118800168 n=1 Tax=Colossoma macropomum TaxID=42526 RepID=UPI001864D214|nr:uncharacterized protein LOC118800168 [Colossoma macropomum]